MKNLLLLTIVVLSFTSPLAAEKIFTVEALTVLRDQVTIRELDHLTIRN